MNSNTRRWREYQSILRPMYWGEKMGSCVLRRSLQSSALKTHTHTHTHNPHIPLFVCVSVIVCLCPTVLLSYWVKVSGVTPIPSTLLTSVFFCLESSSPEVCMAPSTLPSGHAHIRASLDFFPDTSFRDSGSSLSDLSLLCSLQSSCQHLTSHSRSLCMSVFFPMRA